MIIPGFAARVHIAFARVARVVRREWSRSRVARGLAAIRRVGVDFAAPSSTGFRSDPVERETTVPLGSLTLSSDEIIHVQETSAGEVLGDRVHRQPSLCAITDATRVTRGRLRSFERNDETPARANKNGASPSPVYFARAVLDAPSDLLAFGVASKRRDAGAALGG